MWVSDWKTNQSMLAAPSVMAHGVLVRTIAILNTVAVFIVAIVMAAEQRESVTGGAFELSVFLC
ncbi:hypothetical protein [Hafnia alvei]|uniref:hypothetical protein n=1 Tax=Hafnia alvei TaxID=569 RepID=UPI001033315C|nr:hypothetical protein [Hafnia alvei]TBL89517.1 hypothetical protein EYY88_02380 [Hafnia alvei]